MGDGVSMEKIRNLSLKKTMVLYTILSLIVTFFLSVSIIEIAGQIQEEVWWKYVDQDEYYQAMNDRNENFEVVVPRPKKTWTAGRCRNRTACIYEYLQQTLFHGLHIYLLCGRDNDTSNVLCHLFAVKYLSGTSQILYSSVRT